MQSLFDRELLVVTGKGGVGKTTIAAAAGLAGARAGRRTIVVEVGQESRLPGLFGLPSARPGVPCALAANLWGLSIDPDRALLEWLQVLGGRVSGRVLASSGTFQYFAAAAPGAKELVTMVKIWRLTTARGARAGTAGHDLVVLDAPATGHALGLLGSPHTFGAIARVGPIAGQTRKVQELLQNPQRSAYLGVALATEMAVTEALELQDGLRTRLGRELAAVVVNALLPQRFSAAELERIASVAQQRASAPDSSPQDADQEERARRRAVTDAALSAAQTVHRRARFQHNQLARLRRREFTVLGIPFMWRAQLDAAAVGAIATRLQRAL
ncbi:MAG TPA: ArsA-related P-loop ATPase [Solirubrobacteraceae bacterium]|nr:ArsA-related P-loop ATPase [Solirubrobacteraceae bacterium]